MIFILSYIMNLNRIPFVCFKMQNEHDGNAQTIPCLISCSIQHSCSNALETRTDSGE